MWIDNFTLPKLKLSPKTPTAITIGTLDGVHIGHQRLIKTLLDSAAKHRLTPIVFTFKKKPADFFNAENATDYIDTLDERIRHIKKLGTQYVSVLEFNKNLQSYSTVDFLRLLKQKVNTELIVLGKHAFIGSDRLSAELVADIAQKEGVMALVIDEITLDGEGVQSSRIRALIKSGDLAKAEMMLNRRFALGGNVVTGDKLGRKLGFPTANLQLVGHTVVPANGVYATRVHIGDKIHKGATSIGVRPTVSADGIRTIETYILDFDSDIYGQFLNLEFVWRIRDELKFDSLDDLKAQMENDVKQARRRLQNE